MTRYAVYLPEWSTERWSWLLDFTLAGLSFEHSFDLLLGVAAQQHIDDGSADALRAQKQMAALLHHGLGEVKVIAHNHELADYAHVFRF